MHALANNRTIIMLSLQLFKNRWTGETGPKENLQVTVGSRTRTALEWCEALDGNGWRHRAEQPDIRTNLFVHTVRAWHLFCKVIVVYIYIYIYIYISSLNLINFETRFVSAVVKYRFYHKLHTTNNKKASYPQTPGNKRRLSFLDCYNK